MNEKEVGDREHIYGNQRREYESCVKKLDNLIDMRANDELDADEFKERKAVLLAEKERTQSLLKDTDNRIENWLEIAERGFNFAESAQRVFEVGSLEVKKKIFSDLGSNFILKDGKLNVDVDILLFAINNLNQWAQTNPAMLEPAKNGSVRQQSASFRDGLRAKLGDRDSNPN